MLTQGDKAPKFSLLSDDGKTVHSKDLAPAGKTLVLFFYPKDDTPGCTRECQAFSATKKDIEKAGGVLVGVSRDAVARHQKFKEKYGLEVRLLSDPDRKVHEAFGAWGEKVMYGKKVEGAIRSTFLVRDGVVVKVFPKVSVDGHADAVLAALRGEDATAAPKTKTAAAKKKAATATSKKKTTAKRA